MTSLNLITLKVPSSNTVSLGVRAPTYDFLREEGHNSVHIKAVTQYCHVLQFLYLLYVVSSFACLLLGIYIYDRKNNLISHYPPNKRMMLLLNVSTTHHLKNKRSNIDHNPKKSRELDHGQTLFSSLFLTENRGRNFKCLGV